MNPIYQTRYGKGKGNCFQAALASLFEVNLDDVPDFCNIYSVDDGMWYKEYLKWLNKKGYTAITFDIHGEFNLGLGNLHDCFLLVTGKNSDNVNHCVIYRNGKPIHNPNKNCKGIIPEAIDIIFPLDVGKFKRSQNE